MTLRQREPRLHDAAHLAYVRSQRCCALRHCKRKSEAAHIRMECLALGKEMTGYGEKPSDCWTVPLCAYHHRVGIDSQHNVGEKIFWAVRGVDPFKLAMNLWIESGGAERAARPKPIKKRRPIPPRKPPELRVKIPPGRKLQSRGFEKRT